MEIQIPKDDEVASFNESSSLISNRSRASSVRSNRMQIELEEEYDKVIEETLGNNW